MWRIGDNGPAEGKVVNVVLGYDILHQPFGRVGVEISPELIQTIPGQCSGPIGWGGGRDGSINIHYSTSVVRSWVRQPILFNGRDLCSRAQAAYQEKRWPGIRLGKSPGTVILSSPKAGEESASIVV